MKHGGADLKVRSPRPGRRVLTQCQQSHVRETLGHLCPEMPPSWFPAQEGLPWPCKGEGVRVHTAVNLIPQEQTAFPPFPVQSPILPLPVGGCCHLPERQAREIPPARSAPQTRKCWAQKRTSGAKQDRNPPGSHLSGFWVSSVGYRVGGRPPLGLGGIGAGPLPAFQPVWGCLWGQR